MSLFKAKEFWSHTIEGEEFGFGSLGVLPRGNDQEFTNFTEWLVLGSFEGVLRVINPAAGLEEQDFNTFKPEQILVEQKLEAPILQVACGLFSSSLEEPAIAVLHPRKLVVYRMLQNSGIVDHGDQYSVHIAYEHYIERSTYALVCGPFGGVKDKDFICVQCLDGALYFYEMENAAFHRFLPDTLLPSPIAYVSSTDSFVTATSSGSVVSYKYQVIASSTTRSSKEQAESATSGKRITRPLALEHSPFKAQAFSGNQNLEEDKKRKSGNRADWQYNTSDVVTAIFATHTVDETSSIIVVGQRTVYCFTNTGRLRFAKKLNVDICSSYYYRTADDGAVAYFLVTANDSLLLLSDTTLKWAALLPLAPVNVMNIRIGHIRGLILANSPDGHVQCLYLGTDPALFGLPRTTQRVIDYENALAEMEELKETLKQTGNQIHIETKQSPDEDDLEIHVIFAAVDAQSKAHETEIAGSVPVPSLKITAVLDPRRALDEVQVTLDVPHPFTAVPARHRFYGLTSKTEVSWTVYVKYADVPHSLNSEIHAVYSLDDGSTSAATKQYRLPLEIICSVVEPMKSSQHKLTIDTTGPLVPTNLLYPEFNLDEQNSSSVSFRLFGDRAPQVTILASKSGQKYRLQTDHFEMLWVFMEELLRRLQQQNRSNPDFAIGFNGALPLSEFYTLVEHYFDLGQKEQKVLEALDQKTKQLYAIQKQLLVKYKDPTPSPLSHIDAIFEASHQQVQSLAAAMVDISSSIESLSYSVSAMTSLLLCLIDMQFGLSPDDKEWLTHIISPCVVRNREMGWHQRVDISMMHTLAALDNPGETQSLSENQLKLENIQRFKQHVTVICEKAKSDISSVFAEGTVKKPPAKKREKKLKRLGTIDEDSNAFDMADSNFQEPSEPSAAAFGQLVNYAKEDVEEEPEYEEIEEPKNVKADYLLDELAPEDPVQANPAPDSATHEDEW